MPFMIQNCDKKILIALFVILSLQIISFLKISEEIMWNAVSAIGSIAAAIAAFYSLKSSRESQEVAKRSLVLQHEMHIKEVLKQYITSCQGVVVGGKITPNRESLATMITACLKACEWINYNCSHGKSDCKVTDLDSFFWNLLPYSVWEELNRQESLSLFKDDKSNDPYDAQKLTEQYNKVRNHFFNFLDVDVKKEMHTNTTF